MKNPTPPLLAVLGAALLLTSGCVSSKYKLAPTNTHPPVALNLTATPAPPVSPSSARGGGQIAETQPSVDTTVQSVIAYQGPGSWKRESFWDEYVVSIVNRSATPLVIESATLTDFQGNTNVPGAEPWKLEGESKTWWQKAKSSQTGNLLVLGAGAVGLGTTLAVAAVAASGGLFAPATAASSALAGAAAATLVVAPIYAVTVMVINSNNKAKVVAEFQRRRLDLPLTLAPGATAQGSFFFRISPAPSRLALRRRAGGEPFDTIVDLTALRGLHFKAPAPPPPVSAAKSSGP